MLRDGEVHAARRQYSIRVAGIWPLTSVRKPELMKNQLRVSVPDTIIDRHGAWRQTPKLTERGDRDRQRQAA